MSFEPPEIDPHAPTQPITVVTPAEPLPAPVVRVAPAPNVEPVPLAPANVKPAPYVHRFSSVPTHLFGRTAAFLIDWFGVAYLIATFGFHGFERGFMLLAHNASGYVSLVGLAFGGAVLFAFVCEALFGTTLGKLVFGLHVRRGNGRHPGVGRIVVRTLLRAVDILLIGPLLIAVTPRRQRLGDFAAATVVSGSPIRWFAPILGLALVGGLLYAQITYGGGIDSGMGVGAETVDYAPGILAGAAAAADGLLRTVAPAATQVQPATTTLPQLAVPTAGPTDAPAPATDAPANP